jgi:hypothetical protein
MNELQPVSTAVVNKYFSTFTGFKKLSNGRQHKPVLRIRIRIRMNPHGFGLQDPHPESAFQMRISDADAHLD